MAGKYCSGLVSQFCDVVLVRHTFGWENPRGPGFWNGEGMGRGWGGDGSGEIIYEQPGTKVDGILSQQGGFQVSRREAKGMGKGKSRKQGDCAIVCCSIICVYIIIACNCPNDCKPVYVYMIIA